jgi:hypothetical protein
VRVSCIQAHRWRYVGSFETASLTSQLIPDIPSLSQVTIQFSPHTARKFIEVCYVELEGHAERQAVVLSGAGLGPCAIFSYDVLDIGSAYVNTLYRYSVQLENRGDIPAPFSIQQGKGDFGSMFTFLPPEGVVAAETTLNIEVELLAKHIGRLEEKVLVNVTGIDAPLSLQFKGKVVGPTCEVDTDHLDFGMLAYGFRYWLSYMLSLLLGTTPFLLLVRHSFCNSE